jgi:hypothetical protein
MEVVVTEVTSVLLWWLAASESPPFTTRVSCTR